MDIKRNRNAAAIANPARTRRPPAAPKPELVKYSFNLDEIKSIKITRMPMAPFAASGVVVQPPRPRPFKIELTIDPSGQ